jgi:hypothetical protein
MADEEERLVYTNHEGGAEFVVGRMPAIENRKLHGFDLSSLVVQC